MGSSRFDLVAARHFNGTKLRTLAAGLCVTFLPQYVHAELILTLRITGLEASSQR
ncbi:MAG: hypothetical protein KDH15_05950 [Rhodocyclaceae bacterium]|nr:hypothetical protein [Rhodocyclaceae bacterium]